MARTDHGQNLTALIEQPGASFRITKSGADSGTRIFTCDRSMAAALAPAKGSADVEFPTMFVEDVEISFTRNGLAELTVTYTGTVKDPTTEPDTESGIIYRMNAQVDFYQVGTKFLSKYTPTVSHTYATTVFPSYSVGEEINPPKFADKIPAMTFRFTVGTVNGTLAFGVTQSAWRLHNRDVTATGNSYEITDTYIYDYKIKLAVIKYDDGVQEFSIYDEPK